MPLKLVDVPRKVYRISFGADPLALAPEEILKEHPGRWDPPDLSFRVLYTSSALDVAYIEALSDLRPNAQALHMLSDVTLNDPEDDSPIHYQDATKEYLLRRTAAVLIVPNHAEVADVAALQSRTFLEGKLKVGRRLKIGDFTGADLTLPRRSSQYIKASGCCGIASPSAEASPFDADARNYTFFETDHDSGAVMVDIVQHTVVPALDEKIALNIALRALGIDAVF